MYFISYIQGLDPLENSTTPRLQARSTTVRPCLDPLENSTTPRPIKLKVHNLYSLDPLENSTTPRLQRKKEIS